MLLILLRVVCVISHLATRTLPLLARGAQGGLLLADAHSGTSGAQYIGKRPRTLGQSRHVTSTLLVGQAGTTAGTRPLSHTAGTMITQFFVLSPRGDTIISKQCACGGNAMCWRVVRVQAHVVLGGEFNAMGVEGATLSCGILTHRLRNVAATPQIVVMPCVALLRSSSARSSSGARATLPPCSYVLCFAFDACESCYAPLLERWLTTLPTCHACARCGWAQNVDNTHFLYVKKNGLFFVVTTKVRVWHRSLCLGGRPPRRGHLWAGSDPPPPRYLLAR